MKLKYQVQNCLAFGKTPVEIDLNTPGLTSIRGKHLSSRAKSTNGVGKSSILNTVFWILWGKYPKDFTKAMMVNSDTGKNCLGQAWLEIGGRKAEIIRGIACEPKTFHDIEIEGDFLLFFVENQDTRGDTMSATQAHIDSFLTLDYESFATAALFTTTEDSFSGKTSGKQEEVFSKLLKLEDLEEARKKVVLRRKEVKAEIETLEQRIDTTNSLSAREHQRLTQVASSLKEWEVTQNRKQVVLEEEIEELEDEAETLHTELDTEKASLEKETAVLKVVEKEVAVLAQKETQFKEAVKVQDLKIRELERNIGAVSGKIRDYKTDIRQAQSMRGKVVCDKCFEPVKEQHLFSVIDEKNQALEQHEQEKTKLQAEVTKAQNALEKAQTTLREIDTKSNEKLRQETRVSRVVTQISTLTDKIKRVEQLITGKERLVVALQKEEPPKALDTQEIEATMQGYEKTLVSLKSEKEQAQMLMEDLDFCEKMFGPTGIRNLLIRSVIPKLNEHANRFASILTDGELSLQFVGEKQVGTGKRTETRNKLEVKVFDMFGSEKYAAESGGEKRRVDIVVNLALNYLVAERFGLPFAVMDEIFLSLDNCGKEKVMELLRVVQKEIPSIFVISNTEDINNESFDNIWTVSRKGKSSWVEKS